MKWGLTVKRPVMLFVMIAVIATLLVGCGKKADSVVGTWVVKEYEIEDEVVSKDNIKDYLGELSEQNNKWQLDFTSNGNLVITSPNFADGDVNEEKASYSVQDGKIEVFDPDDTSDFELIDFDGDNIRIELSSGFVIVLEKK